MKAIMCCLSLLLVSLPVGFPAWSQQGVTTLNWQQGDKCEDCDSFFQDGFFYEVIHGKDGVTVGMTLSEVENRIRTDVFVVNGSKKKISVLPVQVLMWAGTIPKADGNIDWKEIRQQNPEDIARSLARRAQWRGALAGLAAALQTNETRSESTSQETVSVFDQRGNVVTGTGRGSAETRTTSPNYEARRQAAEIAERGRAEAADAISYLNRIILRANTIAPQERINGAVFFDRPKERKNLLLCLRIDETATQYYFHFASAR